MMPLNPYILFAILFLFTFSVGRLLERIRIPWVFAALLLGLLLAANQQAQQITQSEVFTFFSQLGMYFLLFLVGMEINVTELVKKRQFIVFSSFFIIITEGLVGSVLIHMLFHYSWTISLLVAMSFATVGEAILIPILDEFHIINTPLGQSIIGIGTVDDIIEIITLIAASVLVGKRADTNVFLILGSLAALFLMTLSLRKLKAQRERFQFASIESLFVFILFILFLFIGIGSFSGAEPLAAILAGVSIRSFLPSERLKVIESEIHAVTYGFFAPIFFLKVGSELNIGYLMTYPVLIILFVLVSKLTKITTSIIAAKSSLGLRGSILMGIGLSVRFSTSIIVIKFLYDSGLVGADVYSIIVASSIAFKFIVPLLFSYLLVRWKFAPDSHHSPVFMRHKRG